MHLPLDYAHQAKQIGGSMAHYQRSQSETMHALQEQREFLRASCIAYDQGVTAEAKRIANALYIIAFDGSGSNSRSLLGQLGLKNRIKMISSAKEIPWNIMPRTFLANLLVIDYRVAAEFVPVCYDDCGLKPATPKFSKTFSAWWEETIIEKPTALCAQRQAIASKEEITRKNLVFHMRSIDNGAHFDSKMKDVFYTTVAATDGIGIGAGEIDPIPIRPHLATMRQMGWEVERSLQIALGGPDLVAPPAFAELRRRLQQLHNLS